MKERDTEARAVFLVGFMGAGKTSVGRALSKRLEWSFEDLDDLIQSREGRSIEAIFLHCGEAEFRRMEHAALQVMVAKLSSGPRIIGLGGGAFVQPANMDLLERTGVPTVFLDAGVEELWRRCQEQAIGRPLQRDERQFRELYERRRSEYLKASIRVDTAGKSVEIVAEEVVTRLGLRSKVDAKEW